MAAAAVGDGALFLAAFVFQIFALIIFAVLWRQCWVRQHPTLRYAVGVLVFSAFLVIQPFIYFTPTQMFGLVCSAFAVLTAFAVLHWTFLADPHQTPTILEVVLSPISHGLDGIIKVQQRSLHTGRIKPAAQTQHHSGRTLLVTLGKTVTTALMCAVTWDVGMDILCYLSNNMCSGDSAPSWLGRHAFAFAAGVLLQQKLELLYSTIRALMCLLAFVFPALAQVVAQMPDQANNRVIVGTSVSEVWGSRWHQILRFHMENFGRAIVNVVLPKDKGPAALRAIVRCVVVFAISGLLHEYILWAAFDTVSGLHLAFFMLNCAAVVAEAFVPRLLAGSMSQKCVSTAAPLVDSPPCTATASVTLKARASKAGNNSNGCAATLKGSVVGISAPTWLKHAWTVSFFFLVGPLFIEPYRAAGFFGERAFRVFGVPVASAALGLVRH